MDKEYVYDEGVDKGNYLSFENGIINCSTYSYYIDSFGDLELDKEETYKLFLAMKEYYEGD